MARSKQSMDGNTAAAHVSYAFSEVAGIYPITPSSPMADVVDQWSALDQKNIFGTQCNVMEMQSEAGAAGTVHGSLAAGALTTTYTASQGLLLMIPNMYKIAGELLPCVFHVSARTLASHALSIFGDHSDVYACRQTGFAMLAESNPQEVMDLSAVAHLATLESRVPFLNFFDGFRTSHEIQKIEVWDYADLKEMCNMDAVEAFRTRSLSPENPTTRGSHQNGDIFFQNREACNKFYDAVPEIVQKYMDKVNAKLNTGYKLFEYYGAADADRVIICMGSFCDVAEEVIDYMTAAGEKVGMVKVRLYRPFAADKLLEAIPQSAKTIAVLDRTKEPGALAEPLHLDVLSAFREASRDAVIIGGRYGLSSKDTPPSSVFAVFEEMKKSSPKPRFTVGINDDVTYLSLPETDSPNTAAPGTIECKFWGLGGDGTVGANKNSTKIIGDHTDKYIQSYFQYDSKKTGGVTISHLRFGDSAIRAPYYVNKADFVACHNPSYVIKGFKMVNDVKAGGIFMINCQWSAQELNEHMPAEAKRYIAENNVQLYTINAIDKAIEIGLGKRTNTILQSAFFALANVLPREDAIRFMKEAAYKSFSKKGDAIVEMNYKAIDAGFDAYVKIDVPADWKNAQDTPVKTELKGYANTVKMVENLLEPIAKNVGDSLPVSAFTDHVNGEFAQGASAYEKRGVAVSIPNWIVDKCIQCNQCAYVCPHATIRPYALTVDEKTAAPSCLKSKKMNGKGCEDYEFTLAVSPMDCMGCGVCAQVCPAQALVMESQEAQLDQQDAFDYCVANVDKKENMPAQTTVKGSQFNQPLLEFSGSCAGCAETSYARLITQLFGERMFISNATGCSSIWGGPAAASPYTRHKLSGRGPAWANSLFEDNAEHGFGMYLGQKALRDNLIEKVTELASTASDAKIKTAAEQYIATIANGNENLVASDALVAAIGENPKEELCKEIINKKQYLAKKSVWIFGGDGWAYDIGFGGLDHVLAAGEDVNIMVFDTEVYSNTGGQASKASQIGQVAQFAAAGKGIGKKSLSEIAMSYGYVYVAQIAMGANQKQTLDAILEAESYPGPSLIIGYSPCEMHGIKGGMTNCQLEMKNAVAAGYWNMFRFDPRKKAEGKNPFTMDSKAPTASYEEFINNETRYSRLVRAFPDRAEMLFEKAANVAQDKYEYLSRLAELYK